MRATVHFDGAAKGNPGPAGAGAVVRLGDGPAERLERSLEFEATNNVAEYLGLILGLERALERGARRVRVVGDSQLIVRQVNGRYRVNQPHLRPLHARAVELLRRFEEHSVEWVRRGENSGADALSQAAAEAARGRRLTPYGEWKAEMARRGKRA